ncbi:MAG: diguanylate cyclase [Ilumatobacteraceae bacterium]
MRYVRLGALFGSLVLLVATSVSLFNRRAELRNEQDIRVVAASLGAESGIESTILRAKAIAEVAGPESSADDVVESFGAGAAACVASDGDVMCTGPDLISLRSFGAAAAGSAADGGRAIAVADPVSESVLVVSRSDRTVAVQLPAAAFVDAVNANQLPGDDATVAIVISESSAESERSPPIDVDGRRAVLSVDGESLNRGSVEVTASVADEVGIGGDAPLLFGTLLAFGTILLALAGWTFLVERRSLEHQATTDELTGLANRREFERVSDEALTMSERFGTGLCVMLIDLNGFKQVNDTMGHQFGDVVLKACAERLTSAVRETDVVGRWGGDEFVILLPGLEDGTAVRNSAERIATGLSRTPVAGDVYISGSVGAALYPRHGTTLDELMRNADAAMYGAKSSGVTLRVADPRNEMVGDAARGSYEGPDRRRRRDRSDSRVV